MPAGRAKPWQRAVVRGICGYSRSPLATSVRTTLRPMRRLEPPARPLHLARVLLVCVGLALTLPAAAQWKWRDANGRVTASDLPPPHEVPEKDILQRPGTPGRRVLTVAAPAASAASAPSAPRVAPAGDKELQARKRAAEQEQLAKVKAEEQRNAAIRAENCSRARSHLATLDSGQRMARINAKGEREIIDDQTRAEEARRARQVIASDCR